MLESLKWIRWRSLHHLSSFLLSFLCFIAPFTVQHWSTHSKVTLEWIWDRSVKHALLPSWPEQLFYGADMQVSTQCLCHTQKGEEASRWSPAQSLWCMCRSAGNHNTFLKIHWRLCTWKKLLSLSLKRLGALWCGDDSESADKPRTEGQPEEH